MLQPLYEQRFASIVQPGIVRIVVGGELLPSCRGHPVAASRQWLVLFGIFVLFEKEVAGPLSPYRLEHVRQREPAELVVEQAHGSVERIRQPNELQLVPQPLLSICIILFIYFLLASAIASEQHFGLAARDDFVVRKVFQRLARVNLITYWTHCAVAVLVVVPR